MSSHSNWFYTIRVNLKYGSFFDLPFKGRIIFKEGGRCLVKRCIVIAGMDHKTKNKFRRISHVYSGRKNLPAHR